MEEAINSPISPLDIWRRRWVLITLITGLMLLVTAGLAFGLPAVYRAKAVILIEQQEVPQDLVRSLVTSFAEQRLQTISQRVLTSANLSEIVKKYELYTRERRRDPMERILENMRKDIKVKTISADVYDPRQGRSMQATIAFELTYENKTPQLAQRVANELVTLFLNENLRSRSESTELTLTFLIDESDRLRKEVAALETKLATFKEGHANQLPELENLNREIMNRTEQDISTVETRLSSLEQERVYLESEILQQQPIGGSITVAGDRVLSPRDQVKVAESELVKVTARYGANHPDVIAKRKEVESLRKEVGAGTNTSELDAKLASLRADLAAKADKYSPSHPDVKRLQKEIDALVAEIKDKGPTAPSRSKDDQLADNPAYIQLKARLEANKAEAGSLVQQRVEMRAKLRDLEGRLTAAPQVEREYRQLVRDYDNASKKYEEVSAKKQEADLAKNLEKQQKGERFTLIEPPLFPEEPASPNRLAIGFIGVVISLAGGLGSGALNEALDPAIHGRSGVQNFLGVPPIASIPVFANAAELTRQRRKKIVFALLLIGLVLTGLLIIHVFVKPLDVAWFILLHQVGM